MLTATVTSKGQITIPLAVRRKLGLKEGDRVTFLFEGGQALLVPAGGRTLMELRGALAVKPSLAQDDYDEVRRQVGRELGQAMLAEDSR